MRMSFAEMRGLVKDISTGLCVDPKVRFWGAVPFATDKVHVKFENCLARDCTILGLDGWVFGEPPSSEFSYRWDLRKAFVTDSDVQFVDFLELCEEGMEREAKERCAEFAKYGLKEQCAKFAKNGLTDRLADWALRTLHRVEDELVGCRNAKELEERYASAEFVPEGFPWRMAVEILAWGSELYPNSAHVYVTVSDDPDRWNMSVSTRIDFLEA